MTSTAGLAARGPDFGAFIVEQHGFRPVALAQALGRRLGQLDRVGVEVRIDPFD